MQRQPRNTAMSVITLTVLCIFHVGIFCASSVDASSSWKNAPWQTKDNAVLEEKRYKGLSPTIFSPTGRLHPVEKAMEEVCDPQSNLVVALSCEDGILIFSTIPLSPHLNTTSTPLSDETNEAQSSLFLLGSADEEFSSNNILPIIDLGPGVLGATAGKPSDSQVLRMRLKSMAQQVVDDDLDDKHTLQISVPRLARQMADLLQAPTQKTNGRQGPLMSSAAVVVGERQIWRIDPSGQFWRCDGAIIGRESDKVEDAILTTLCEKAAEESDHSRDITSYLKSLTCEKALDTVICGCLQEIFWPPSLNLQLLPQGVRAHIQSIPWVAVSLVNTASEQSAGQNRRIRRGAFVPRISPGGAGERKNGEKARGRE